jgi:2-C-methyl-D-erythritol 4-phosphate cytidylyltransferase
LKGVLRLINCIILAGGIGKRAKLNVPKFFMRLGGKPLIIHVIDKFLKIKQIDKIIIPVFPSSINEFNDLIKLYYNEVSKIVIIKGGKTRQKSVYKALTYVDSKRVIIHESVRPFVTENHILDLLSIDSDVVIPCIPIVPTITTVDGRYIDRNIVRNVQLPQVFNTEILKKAHEKALNKVYTDDSSLVYYELGMSPTIINGLEENIKITTPLDVKLSEVLYQ